MFTTPVTRRKANNQLTQTPAQPPRARASPLPPSRSRFGGPWPAACDQQAGARCLEDKPRAVLIQVDGQGATQGTPQTAMWGVVKTLGQEVCSPSLRIGPGVYVVLASRPRTFLWGFGSSVSIVTWVGPQCMERAAAGRDAPRSERSEKERTLLSLFGPRRLVLCH